MDEMKFDARKLTPKEQEQLRFKIVRLSKKGWKNPQIMESCECSLSLVTHTLSAYRKGGTAAISLKKMGAPIGASRILTEEQEREIKRLIVDKCPEQLKLPGCLWDRKAARDLIEHRYHINLPLSTMGEYLRRWKFTAQRPTLKNKKQNREEVNTWLEKDYPAVKTRAEEDKAGIFWGDETGIQNTSNYIKGYAPIGQTPVLRTKSEKFKVNMISAVSSRGRMLFMLYRETMTQQRFIEFLSLLVKHCEGKKVYFIVDNLKVHHGKLVQAWLEENKETIEVFYLPAYSPELNPDEYLNGNLKREIAKRRDSKNIDELEKTAEAVMSGIQNTGGRIASFFDAADVKYAK